MSTKTSTVQPPGRRTPLSLNASTKQMHKPANKNDNKKETNSNNNQKTDNSKKDSQQEKRNTVEKKNASTDSRKASSDSKKVDETKTATATIEESKKSQNGVGTNGVKDKDKANTNEGAKSKSETSSAAPTSKKDSQKAAANEGAKSKTDTASVPTTPKKESQKAAAEKKEEPAPPVVVKEIKKEDIKNKEKAKKADESAEEKKNETEMKEETVAEVPETKKSDENTSDTKKIEISKTSEAPEEDNKVVDNLNSSASKDVTASVEQKVDEETATATTENKIEERSNEDNKSVSGQTDDVEMMEPLTYDDELPPVAVAASTPAKPLYSNDFLRREAKTSPKSEAKFSGMFAHTPDRKSHSRPFSAISGRRSIRPVGDYSFSGNLHIRESYRKINTELDFTSSSLNVTVGSEVPNNDSFSFFSRSRKRDRSSPSRQSAMEVQGDISPKSPKRARIDIGMSGFFSAMASPITMLRSRLARTTVQSTPKKQPEAPIDDDVVENVSGISVNEEITATEELTMNPDSTVDIAAIEAEQQKLAENDDPIASSDKPAAEGVKQEDDHKLQDIVVTAVDSQAKKKCSIM